MEQPVYDVVGIGFGPSNIALAVAMQDTGYEGKVLFFESAPHRPWQDGMLLSGSDIQHNALRDFSTPVNPRGYFTFINYLHSNGKLFEYLNVGLTYAYRTEFAAYVDWVKTHFEAIVEANTVEGLEVVRGEDPLWLITTADGAKHHARIAVVGTGRPRRIPDISGMEESDAIIHLTSYLHRIDGLAKTEPVVVVGASQSSAEIVLDLLRRGFENIHLVHRSFSFQLKDTSPFSDEVYFPEFVDYFYSLPASARESLSKELRRTNYSSVDKDVLDEIYRLRYQHSLAGRTPLKIHRNHEIKHVERAHPYHRLTIRERYTGDIRSIEFSLAILATGFLDIGKDGREAVPVVLRDISDNFLWNDEGLQVSRDYEVSFASDQTYPRLFLNGLCETTHGLGDAGSFSLVSIRARDILSGIRNGGAARGPQKPSDTPYDMPQASRSGRRSNELSNSSHRDVFARLESNVRSYCRKFDDLFTHASGAWLTTAGGRRILDFLSGAGSLNYGHNNLAILAPVIEYLSRGGITHSLDLHTEAKMRFLETFSSIILQPRRLDYKMQFPGPTGTDAVEASFKLARKFTGRRVVAAFGHGYHGMTLGALAATSSRLARGSAGVSLDHVIFWPYDGELGRDVDTIAYIEKNLERCNEADKPAAVIVELVQGEGGLGHASMPWLRRLDDAVKKHGVLLIVDDIQAGCGRTGTFFSFEEANIAPDMVLLSKSLSGFGSPFSLVLVKPALDTWQPGEHTGTFRGNNLAFIGATAAMATYWSTPEFSRATCERARLVNERLAAIAAARPGICPRGRGLMAGLQFEDAFLAETCSKALYERSIMAETCGDNSQTLKLLPPLNIEMQDMEYACEQIETVVKEVVGNVSQIHRKNRGHIRRSDPSTYAV